MTIQELMGKYKASGVYDNIARAGIGENTNIVNAAVDNGITVATASWLFRDFLNKKRGFQPPENPHDWYVAHVEREEATILLEHKANVSIDMMIRMNRQSKMDWDEVAEFCDLTDEELTTMRNSFHWQYTAMRHIPIDKAVQLDDDEYYDLVVAHGSINPQGLFD